ncbi:sensor histidine kinase [Parapedobacter sp. GCM10030251]|uniref:sensor histidine kinase n=1 Tax=Parapedobacter sp. GCM10030251 TaxID=3273419 RepID=UPI003611DE39
MRFSYNSRIIKHLGYELITSDEVAITELIKNSYDAKASKVNIHFLSDLKGFKKKSSIQPISDELIKIIAGADYGIIVIEDNGKGMSYETLKNGFFEVGGTLKKKEKAAASDKDAIILGEKGIGRLAAQRISPVLIVETSVGGSNLGDVVYVEWDKFVNSSHAEAPEHKCPNLTGKSYTRLWLIGTAEKPIEFEKFFTRQENFVRDIFGNLGESLGTQLYVKNELHSALSFLYSPFEDNKSILDLSIFFNGEKILHDFNYNIVKIAESIHSLTTEFIKDESGEVIDLALDLRMDVKPWFLERIHHRELGRVLYQDWKRPHTFYSELLKKYQEHFTKSLSEKIYLSDALKKWSKKYSRKLEKNTLDALVNLAPLEAKIYSFKREKALISMAISSAVDNGFIDNGQSDINSDFSNFLGIHNGIKLYRNSFRIGTIGNKDNDWLKLQQKRTTGQQFYRFELGNVIGFIKINDKKQEYIYETSSRENLTDNLYVDSLQILLSEVIEIFSPGFNKRAVEIAKYILDLEGLIPENNTEEIEDEVRKSKEVLEAAKKNLQAINEAFSVINDNIALDDPNKISTIQKIFKELETVTINFEQNINDTNRSFESANNLIEVARQHQKRIKTEAYNNYKLMANGLVTEVITHELHSLLSNSGDENKTYADHFTTLEDYFLDREEYGINREHLLPVKTKFNHLYARMGDLSKFYSFLEKTFIYKGNSEDLEPVNVREELHEITDRFKFRLNRHKINIDIDTVSNIWEVPKGSLLHVFYNLIDNSIYWIKQRQKQAKKNTQFKKDGTDTISVRTIDSNTIQFSDSGTGVLEKYQHTLFNEMESGKEDGGRGMGLYIVRQFLKSFGGEIELLQPLNPYDNRYIFEIRMSSSFEEDQP